MISPHRMAEILHQAVNRELLIKEGEKQAYEDFIMDISPDEDIEKVYTYIQRGRRMAEQYNGADIEKFLNERGRLDAYDKIEEAMIKYGE